MPRSIHGTCVALSGAGVLLRGAPGRGKSDLAWRLIHGADGDSAALLVADDQVVLKAEDGRLTASAPPALKGLIELKGLGLVTLKSAETAPVVLVVDLVDRAEVPHIAAADTMTLEGIALPSIRLHAFDETTPAKIVLALRSIAEGRVPGEDGVVRLS